MERQLNARGASAEIIDRNSDPEFLPLFQGTDSEFLIRDEERLR